MARKTLTWRSLAAFTPSWPSLSCRSCYRWSTQDSRDADESTGTWNHISLLEVYCSRLTCDEGHPLPTQLKHQLQNGMCVTSASSLARSIVTSTDGSSLRTFDARYLPGGPELQSSCLSPLFVRRKQKSAICMLQSQIAAKWLHHLTSGHEASA